MQNCPFNKFAKSIEKIQTAKNCPSAYGELLLLDSSISVKTLLVLDLDQKTLKKLPPNNILQISRVCISKIYFIIF